MIEIIISENDDNDGRPLTKDRNFTETFCIFNRKKSKKEKFMGSWTNKMVTLETKRFTLETETFAMDTKRFTLDTDP